MSPLRNQSPIQVELHLLPDKWLLVVIVEAIMLLLSWEHLHQFISFKEDPLPSENHFLYQAGTATSHPMSRSDDNQQTSICLCEPAECCHEYGEENCLGDPFAIYLSHVVCCMWILVDSHKYTEAELYRGIHDECLA
jgi:hypothetical protein